jgi:FeS assembly protein IscX
LSQNPLYWESTYELVRHLMTTYPDVSLELLGTRQLLTMILDLPDFADDPRLANEALLNEILREWYEEATLS